jgi:acyl-coenzyme A synthetase/AMP-(fatty) acid ligase
MAQYGNLGQHDFSRLRMILFAGEVFPVVQLRSLKRQIPGPRYFNLYGPTETNVCTSYEIPRDIPEDRVAPFPIGKTCAHLSSRVVDPTGQPVRRGDEGELCISGPSVTSGYWGLPEQTSRAFLPSLSESPWYRTGDIVVEEDGGDYRFLGRRDRMVKKRGYRVELGEIEVCLYRHPDVREVAAVAMPDPTGNVVVWAHLAARGEKRLSIIELKSFCSQHLPVYMVPDKFSFHSTLPKTSTDKIDYQSLLKMSTA